MLQARCAADAATLHKLLEGVLDATAWQQVEAAVRQQQRQQQAAAAAQEGPMDAGAALGKLEALLGRLQGDDAATMFGMGELSLLLQALQGSVFAEGAEDGRRRADTGAGRARPAAGGGGAAAGAGAAPAGQLAGAREPRPEAREAAGAQLATEKWGQLQQLLLDDDDCVTGGDRQQAEDWEEQQQQQQLGGLRAQPSGQLAAAEPAGGSGNLSADKLSNILSYLDQVRGSSHALCSTGIDVPLPARHAYASTARRL
jgi:hypothetical protein